MDKNTKLRKTHEKKMKDPLRKHTSRSGLTVILAVNVETTAKNIR